MVDLTGLGSIADLAKGLVDRIWPPDASPADKVKAQLELEKAITERENAVLGVQQAVMTAELNQGDTFTKRARPTIVYAGLVFIFMVHVAFPMITFFKGSVMPALALPTEFWWAWTGVCGVWIIGRSAEKRGAVDSVTKLITGAK